MDHVEEIDIVDTMSASYLDYSMSVIVGRAIPDARDGLKPVHRRILYAMHDLKIRHNTPYKKSARIVGDVIGKYHSHGDCLWGATKVKLTDGTTPTIEEIYASGVENVEVYAYNKETSKIEIATATSFRIGQHTKKIYEIELVSGSKIRCTANHPFLKEVSGEWVKAEDIKTGDELVGFNVHGDVDKSRSGRPIVGSLSYTAERLEVITKRALIGGDGNLIGLDGHHVDGNIYNNSLKNMELLTRSDHTLKHSNEPHRLTALDKGRVKMHKTEGWMKEFIKFKNRTIRLLCNSKLQLLKAINVLRKLDNDYFDIKDSSIYENNRKVYGYNTSSISKLIEQGHIDHYSDLLKILESNEGFINYSREDTVQAFLRMHPGVTIEDIQRTRKKIHQRSGKEYNYIGGVKNRKFIKVIRKAIEDGYAIHDMTWDTYDEYYHRVTARRVEDIYKIYDSRIWAMNFRKPVDVLLAAPGYSNFVVSVKIIEEKEAIPMYDFTVNGLENMLIEVGNGELIVAHNSSVYDAMVRMAQSFSMSMPLVDGQGNFGSIDGDRAASMRYTEVRLTREGEEFLAELDNNTVDFKANYDDSLTEPVVLPTSLPNLLINGTSGIAVGMSTLIPPHNTKGVLECLIAMLDNPKIDVRDLVDILKGPDFPTGGTIYGRKGIYDAYETGKGKIKLRAKTHHEESKTKEFIVIDELPYQVNKAKLIETIALLVRERVIDGIADIRDESDRRGMRVVITLKRGAMYDIVINRLYKHTQLQTPISINMLAIVNGEPVVLSLIKSLGIFIDFRRSILIRGTVFSLEKDRGRRHILEGLYTASKAIKKVISIIQKAATAEDAKADLMEFLNVSSKQVNAILDMRLRSLAGLEVSKIKTELAIINKAIKKAELLLSSSKLINNAVKNNFISLIDKYGSDRLTDIVDDMGEINIKDIIANEPTVVTITHRGYVKRIAAKTYEKQHRGGTGKVALTVHDDDFIESFFTANTHDKLFFITNFGRLYTLNVYDIPEGSRTSKGKAIVNLIDLERDEKVEEILPITSTESGASIIFITRDGTSKRVPLSEFANTRRNGIKAITLEGDDVVVNVSLVTSSAKWYIVATKFGQSIRFNISDIREMGRGAKGNRAIKLKDGDSVIGGLVFTEGKEELLIVSENGVGKRTPIKEYRLQTRGGSGVKVMRLTNKTGLVVDMLRVMEGFDVMGLTSAGKMIRVTPDQISKQSRNSTGVKIIRLSGKESLVSLNRVKNEQ